MPDYDTAFGDTPDNRHVAILAAFSSGAFRVTALFIADVVAGTEICAEGKIENRHVDPCETGGRPSAQKNKKRR